MFDANMRCLPVGKYFADVGSCRKGSLFDMGIRQGMVVMFTKISDDDDNPSVEVYHDDKVITVSCSASVTDHLLIYAGGFDLSDFINERSLQLAKDIKGNESEKTF